MNRPDPGKGSGSGLARGRIHGLVPRPAPPPSRRPLPLLREARVVLGQHALEHPAVEVLLERELPLAGDPCPLRLARRRPPLDRLASEHPRPAEPQPEPRHLRWVRDICSYARVIR